MKSAHRILCPLLSSSLLLSTVLSQSSATGSIYNNPAFTSQRLCALECILCGYGTTGQHDCLAAALSCNDGSPLQNNCYCRSGLQPATVSYVASCVTSACSDTVDIDNAVGIYTSYCATADQTSTFFAASTTQTSITTKVGLSKTTTTPTLVSVVTCAFTATNGHLTTLLVTMSPTTGMTRTLTQTTVRENFVANHVSYDVLRINRKSEYSIKCSHNMFNKRCS
jgi:hypothetical protein